MLSIFRSTRLYRWIAAFVLVAVLGSSLGAAVPVHASQDGTKCYRGDRKAIYYDAATGYHHTIQFDIPSPINAGNLQWYVSQIPNPLTVTGQRIPIVTDLWSGWYGNHQKWMGYRWPYNLADPYVASTFRICFY